ncbi:hypothetical protein ACOAKC_08465 [Hathewaya histolytica]|uniref:hypothetical protein n=1 Tax=Hathewaya histolytica TaxID=1498 RepID=UPI003B6782AA
MIFVLFILVTLGMYISTVKIENALKKAREVSCDSTAYHELFSFFSQYNKSHNKNSILIEERKIFQYRMRDNSIGIKALESKAASDIIPSLHEAGHYISINRSERYKRLYKISVNLVALNRLVVIPLIAMLLIVKVTNIGEGNLIEIENYYLPTLLIIFIIISLFKLTIGMKEEYSASQKAYRYITMKGNETLNLLAKNIYRFSFLQQLFMSLTGIMGIFLFWMFA